MKKVILKVILGSIVLQALLICFFILLGDIGDIGWKSLESVAIVLECAIPCLFYAKIYDIPKYKIVAVLSMCVSGCAALVFILSLWINLSYLEYSGIYSAINKSVSTLQYLMWFLAIISLLLSYNIDKKILKSFRNVSICSFGILYLFIFVIIWVVDFPDGFLARLFYMLVVLAPASGISTIIIAKIYKNDNSIDTKQEVFVSSSNQIDNNAINLSNINQTEDSTSETIQPK